MEGSTSCSVPTIGAPPAKAVTRKNPAKRDRHSKICTAQGTRDRRMRLSLGIARKFFDLQDLLGFDKASKTVEWLLLKSRPAIEQLTAAAQSDAVASAAHAESAVNLAAGDSPESRPDTDPKAKALPRKTAVYVLGKESRGRARERACRRRRVGAGEESGGILSLSSWSPNSYSEVVQPSATATLGEQQQDAGNGFPHEVQNPRVKFLDLPEYWVEAPTTVSNNCTENPLPSPARLMMNYYYDYNCLQTQPEDRFRFYGKVWEGYSPI